MFITSDSEIIFAKLYIICCANTKLVLKFHTKLSGSVSSAVPMAITYIKYTCLHKFHNLVE